MAAQRVEGHLQRPGLLGVDHVDVRNHTTEPGLKPWAAPLLGGESVVTTAVPGKAIAV